MKAYIGLGTNMGDRVAYLKRAIALLEVQTCRVCRYSSVYETEPWGFSSEKSFLNMVLEIETGLNPPELLTELLKTETLIGRKRHGKKYTSRIIDIDILLYGEEQYSEEKLVIPHPLMHERKFVLVPLCEIAPDIVHPVLRKNIAELLDECKDRSEVIKKEIRLY